MRVGVARFVLSIPSSRSLKDRRRVVRSLKDRLRAKLPVSVAEVGNAERLQAATVAVAVVSSDAQRAEEILAQARNMAGTLPEALLTDVRTEMLPFGDDGAGLSRGIEDESFPEVEAPLPGEGLIEPVQRKARR